MLARTRHLLHALQVLLLLLQTVLLLLGLLLARVAMVLLVVILRVAAVVLARVLSIDLLDSARLFRTCSLLSVLASSSLVGMCLQDGCCCLTRWVRLLSAMLCRMTSTQDQVMEVSCAADAVDLLVLVGGRAGPRD